MEDDVQVHGTLEAIKRVHKDFQESQESEQARIDPSCLAMP